MKNILALVFSVVVLALGSYLIIKDFEKEQIKIWDEASSARNAIDMLAGKHFLVQYHDGVPVRDDFKPPLSLWTKMLSYKVFGINEFAVRLPSIIAALLTMFLLWAFGYIALKRPIEGIVFALILVTSQGYVYHHVSRTGDPDALLIFFITGAIVSLFLMIYQRRTLYFVTLGISLTLAMYTKGIMGLAPLAGLGLFVLISKKARGLLADRRLYVAVFSSVIMLGAYYVMREILDPGYLAGVWKYEIYSFREAPHIIKHPEKSFYFNYLSNHGFHVWVYIMPVSIITYILSNDRLIKDLLLYSFMGIVVFVFFMSMAVLKNEWYISPVYPFLAIFTGSTIAGLYRWVEQKFASWLKIIPFIVLVAGLFLLARKPAILINEANKVHNKVVYHPEREGRFLDNVKRVMPDIYNLGVVMPHHQRQLEFYTTKWAYLDNTRVYITGQVPGELPQVPFIVCHMELKAVFMERFHGRILMEDEYCLLIEAQRAAGDSPS